MPKFVWLSCVCVLVLLAPVRAENPKAGPVEKTLAALQKQKPDIDGTKLGDLTATEVFDKLSKQLDVAIVILEDEFRAQKAADIKDKKSPLKKLDTKELTAGAFLDVWLASLGATYKVYPDYIAISPLARAAEKPAKPEKVDPAERLLSVLRTTEVQVREGANINEIPIFELVQDLSKRYGLPFVINETAFRQAGLPNFKEEKPTAAATQLRGMRLNEFLRISLDSMGATYLIRKNYIEIVPSGRAAEVTKSGVTEGEDSRPRLKEPLVSLIVKEKPLNEVVAELAEDHDLNLLIAPAAGDAKTKLVTARLLNVPADKVVELIALQSDLRVVRKGNVLVLTSKAQAAELLNEKAGKDRKKADPDQLRIPTPAPARPVPGTKEK